MARYRSNPVRNRVERVKNSEWSRDKARSMKGGTKQRWWEEGEAEQVQWSVAKQSPKYSREKEHSMQSKSDSVSFRGYHPRSPKISGKSIFKAHPSDDYKWRSSCADWRETS